MAETKKYLDLSGLTHYDEKVKADIDEVKKAENIKIVDTAGKYTSDNVEGALAEIAGAIENAGTVTVEKQATADSGFAASYVIKQNGSQVGDKINIPKDFLVKSAELKSCIKSDSPVVGYKVGDKYIDFCINTKENDGTAEHIYLLVADLVDAYTPKSSATQVQVAISDTNEISASIVAGSIGSTEITDKSVTKSKLTDEIKTSLGKADSAIQESDLTSIKTDVQNLKSVTYTAITNDEIDALFVEKP